MDENFQKYDNGKTTLIVNVASKCTYTDQYEELVELQEKFADDLQVRLSKKMPSLYRTYIFALSTKNINS